jgi:formylglycine-generating enzyme required for sulfatase activity
MRDRSHELDLRWVGLAHSYRRMKLLARRGDGNVVFPRGVSAWFILVGLLISSLTSSSVLAQSHGDSREATADAGSISMATPTVVLLSRLVQSSDAKQIDAEAMTPYSQGIEGTDVVFEMVPIPGGEFLMGSPDSEPGRNADEGPQHRVRLEPFWMGKYEVTWGEFDLWAKTNRKDQKADSSDAALSANELIDAISRPTEPFSDLTFGMGRKGFPAICMTQLAAKCYCKWLSVKTGHYYRLPTEAEWEYACRAGTTTAYSFGDDPDQLDDYGWSFFNGDDHYHEVGQLKPNPWGLFDMHGNVSEWVLDGYTEDYSSRVKNGTARINPFNPPTTIYSRVTRGGSWDDDPEGLRCAARKASRPSWSKDDPREPQSIWYHTAMNCPGFRLVRPLRVPTKEESTPYEPDWTTIKAYEQRQTTTYQ